MKYIIQFQYKGENDLRPQDYSLTEEELLAPDGKTIPIPDVGDGILISNGEARTYKVVSRLFTYHRDNCYINIVVTDLPDEEYGKLIKE